MLLVPAMAVEQQAVKKKKKGCWTWSKEVEEVPLFDDVNCPYGIKPSELFKLNEVGVHHERWSQQQHAKQARFLCCSERIANGCVSYGCRTKTWRS